MSNRAVSWIVVSQYGGMYCVQGRFDEQREAMDFMNKRLNNDKERVSKGKVRGARLTCHVYQLFGSYAN